MHMHAPQPRTHFYRSIAVTFVVLSLIIVGIIFSISFSWATIVVTPQIEYYDRNARFIVAEEPRDEQGVLRGHFVSYDLSASGVFSPSLQGSQVQRARGEITVINNSAKNQPLVATTRFLSMGDKLFRSAESVIVPARRSIVVPVVADAEGDAGDLTQEHFTIPGLWPGLQQNIYGQGFVQRERGVKDVRIVSEDDRVAAQKMLIAKIEEQFALRIESEGLSDTFRPAKLQSIHTIKITSTTFSHALGDQTESFEASLDAHIDAVLYDESDARQYLVLVFGKEVPSGRELLPLDMSRMTVNLVSSDASEHKATMSASGPVAMTFAENYLSLEKRKLTGKTPLQVKEYYDRTIGAGEVEVRLYPFWVTKTPLLYDHISIIVKR